MTEVSAHGTTLMFQRDLRHPPAKVWAALTDPSQLDRWSPFAASRDLSAGGPVTLTMIDGETRVPMEAKVLRAEPPVLLEYTWGDDLLRWELEPLPSGTRLTLHHTVQAPDWLPKAAAGWHICLDVCEQLLNGADVRAIRGQEAMNHGWQELHDRYEKTL
jgi:uncharacterized protein YndB with AHSA1/START domain